MDSFFPPKCKPHATGQRRHFSWKFESPEVDAADYWAVGMALKRSSASLSDCLYPRTFALWWKTAYGVSFFGKSIHV